VVKKNMHVYAIQVGKEGMKKNNVIEMPFPQLAKKLVNYQSLLKMKDFSCISLV
jgi:hypothetical protein